MCRIPLRNVKQVQEVKLWESQAASLSPGENELLYGQAGYLYCLLFLHKRVGPTPGEEYLVGILVHLIIPLPLRIFRSWSEGEVSQVCTISRRERATGSPCFATRKVS